MIFNKLALAIASSTALLLSGCITDPDPDPTPEPVVVQNKAPVIDSIGVLNGVYSVVARDHEGDELAYSWEINNISHGTGTEFTPSIEGLSGMKTVTVVVTDATGNKTVKNVDMDFGNLAPTMSVGFNNGIYTIIADDPEMENMNFAWEIAGVVRSESVSFDPLLIDLDGEIEVVVSVTDSAGNTVTKKVVMTFVKFNQAPVVTIENLDGVLTATATDPEGEDVSYSWNIGADSLSVIDTFDTATLMLFGIQVVSVDVTDTFGNVTTQEISVDLGAAPNNVPTIEPLNAISAVAGNEFELNANAEDLDGDDLTYSWEVDGQTLLGPTHLISIDMEGEFTAQLTVSDGEDEATDSVVITVVENIAPSVNAGSTINAVAGVAFDLFVDVIDIDNNNNDLTYSWVISDGQTIEGQSASLTINNAGSFTAEVTVFDGINTVTDMVNISVTAVVLPNTPPVVNAGYDLSVESGQVLSLVGMASDKDNDTLTYSWNINGQDYAGSNAVLVINEVNDYVATLSVFDGTTTVTDTVNVSVTEVVVIPENTRPLIEDIIVTESTLTAVASDADGDDLVYVWKIERVILGSTEQILLEDAPSFITGINRVVLTVSDGKNIDTQVVNVDFGTITNDDIVDDYEGQLPVVDPEVTSSAQAVLDAYDGSLPVPESVTKAAALILADTTGQEVSGGVIYIPTVEGARPTIPYTVQVTQSGDVNLVPLPVPHIFDYGTANSFILDDFADNDHQNNLGGAVGTIHCENYTEGGGYWYVFGESGLTNITNEIGLDINPYNIIEAVAQQSLFVKMQGGTYAGVGTNLVFEEYETELANLDYIEVTVKGSGQVIPMLEPIYAKDLDWGNYAADPITLSSAYTTISIPVGDFIGEEHSDMEGNSFVTEGKMATKFLFQAKSKTSVDVEIYIDKIEFFGNGLKIEDVGFKGMTKQESEAEIAHCNLDRSALDVPSIAENPNLDYVAFEAKHGVLGQPNESITNWVAPSLTTTGSLNWLTLDGRILRDSNGTAVRLTGVNWFGFETRALITMGLWKDGRTIDQMLSSIVAQGFNTVRIPFSDEVIAGSLDGSILLENLDIDLTANPIVDMDADSNITPLDLLDVIINKARALNLKVILDSHSRGSDKYLVEGLWEGDYGSANFGSEANWIQNWEMLATRYKNNDAVVAFDLNNEPHFAAAWGSTDTSKNWNEAAQRAANAIQAIHPDVLIIVEGVEHLNGDQDTNKAQQSLDSYWWGGNLQGVTDNAINITYNNKLVYSPHEYGPEVYVQPWFKVAGFPRNLPYLWEDRFGFIYQQSIGHLFVGEFGIKYDMPGTASNIWFDSFLTYMCERKEGYSWTFWAWNPNSGDTGGILGNDWEEVNSWKVDKLSACQAPLIGNNNG
ncbi:MAG: cellulase family glycosylhydrolase [Pseudomonadales bacterium]|uniref:glycoside hydrolase family 5 protein n=1 Tax=Moritella sp. TaxID=78556 RepID=UPI001D6832F2|nr:cellulase family glycosylhydrolase [Moritella sp.]MCJ8313963.1 cellulase family glycosylhydrolase [Pseudomonadales bacterium]NQZ51006.1 cellulase family glycosylhydrolase [Moritella sp.]